MSPLATILGAQSDTTSGFSPTQIQEKQTSDIHHLRCWSKIIHLEQVTKLALQDKNREFGIRYNVGELKTSTLKFMAVFFPFK